MQIPLKETFNKYWSITLQDVDYVPASLPTTQDAGCRLVMCEDNDAVIKMLRKGRAPMMSHVARTHRVNLDWLLERSYTDPNVYCRYVDTKMQLADLLTKMNFTSADWLHLCGLLRLGAIPPEQRIAEEPPLPTTSTSSSSSSKAEDVPRGGLNVNSAEASYRKSSTSLKASERRRPRAR